MKNVEIYLHLDGISSLHGISNHTKAIISQFIDNGLNYKTNANIVFILFTFMLS